MITSQDFVDDIPESLAYDAHRGTSWVPEQRAIAERESYAERMAAFYREILALAGEDRRNEALAELERYRQRYLRAALGALNSHSRIVSPMIAGPSNFPARRMQKLNDAYDNRIKNWIAWDEKVRARIRRKFQGGGPIRTGEASAVDELTAKLERDKTVHQYMVEINKLFRRKMDGDQRLAEIERLSQQYGIDTSKLRHREFLDPNYQGRGAFPDYALRNSNARIKSAEAALAKAKSLASQTTTERTVYDVRIMNNVEDDRLQVFFPERVSNSLYKLLSSHGFRHSRRNGCFQAFRGSNANYWLQEILKEYAKEKGIEA